MMQQRGKLQSILLLMVMMLTLSSCYHSRHGRNREQLTQLTEKQLDSITFSSTHHYTNNYNFIVKSDSFDLIRQLPEELISNMMTDSFAVKKHAHLVVADIRIVPNDSIDSVWVQLGTEHSDFGWVHESELLVNVVPDDPISQFISTFSDTHMIIFLIVIAIMATAYIIRVAMKENAKIVHFNDIDSFYPTALVLIVATSAAFYASIQVYAPDTWRNFYYHPTLNPFALHGFLSIFLSSVWLMVIVGIACIDEVYHRLSFGESFLYLLGLLAVCAIDYIIFSISTLYFIGYFLLAAYYYFAIMKWVNRNQSRNKS
ncbi:MAG TPA: beta-carotene 15,15'-monooxygenase [Prevotella sp.]|nr:beta-carotene 15,15'-monooxygenase [Prevotella sp.]